MSIEDLKAAADAAEERASEATRQYVSARNARTRKGLKRSSAEEDRLLPAVESAQSERDTAVQAWLEALGYQR